LLPLLLLPLLRHERLDSPRAVDVIYNNMRRRSLTRHHSKGQTVTTTNVTPRFTGLAAIGALMALALAILACGGGDAKSGSTTIGGLTQAHLRNNTLK
jgi:hypothetical protein